MKLYSFEPCACGAPFDKAHILCYGTWVDGQSCTLCGTTYISKESHDAAKQLFGIEQLEKREAAAYRKSKKKAAKPTGGYGKYDGFQSPL